MILRHGFIIFACNSTADLLTGVSKSVDRIQNHEMRFSVIAMLTYLCTILTPRFSGSGLCPCGRGGVLSLWNKTIACKNDCHLFSTTENRDDIVMCHKTTHLGSCWPVLPRPYRGITLSRLMPALQTGHTCLLGLVSSHCIKTIINKDLHVCISCTTTTMHCISIFFKVGG